MRAALYGLACFSEMVNTLHCREKRKRVYVPETASLGKTLGIVTLLWCSDLLCVALGYLVGPRLRDRGGHLFWQQPGQPQPIPPPMPPSNVFPSNGSLVFLFTHKSLSWSQPSTLSPLSTQGSRPALQARD